MMRSKRSSRPIRYAGSFSANGASMNKILKGAILKTMNIGIKSWRAEKTDKP
jgi:hypothetical protein